MSSSRAKGLKAELNPICHLLALLGAHLILHINRIRDKDRFETKKTWREYSTCLQEDFKPAGNAKKKKNFCSVLP